MAQIQRSKVRTRKGTPVKQGKPAEEFDLTGRAVGEVKYVRGVFFGPPKTAKTTVACSGRKVLLIQFDPDGDLAETLEGREDITVVEPRTQKEIDSLIKQLHSGAHERWDWIVVDSLTFLFLTLGGKEITQKWKDDVDFRRAYGKAGAAVQQVIHDLVTLPCNVIFTAHLERVDSEDEDGVPLDTKLGENEVKIAVTPMVWRILGPAVSFFGRTFKEDVYETETVDGKKKRNKRTRYAVSFNDGDRSPAGSRLKMAGEYEVTDHMLADLAEELIGGN